MSRRSFLSAVPLVAVLCGLAALFAWQNAETEKDQVRARIASGAAAAAATTDQYLIGRIEILKAIATRRAFQLADAGDISDEIARIDAPARGFGAGVFSADPLGRLRAPQAASPIDESVGRDIQTVVRTGDPYVSDAIVVPGRPAPVLVFAVPTRNTTGEVNGALVGVTRVAELAELGRRLESASEEVRLVDRAGSLLFPLSASGALIAVDGRSPYPRMRQTGAGVVDARVGLTGSRDRIIGYATASTSGWLVTRSESRSRALAGPATSLRLELLTLLVAGALVSSGLHFASRQEARTSRERALLLEAERLARTRAELLEHTAEHLAAAQTVADVAGSVTTDIEQWGMDVVIVQMLRDMEAVETCAATGIAPAWHERSWVSSSKRDDVVARAMRTDSMIVFQTGQEHDAQFPEWANERRRHDVETVVAVPLHSPSGRVVGALLGASRQQGWLTEDRRKVFVGIAEQCGLALERARLQDLTETAAADAELLARVSDSLSRATSVDERARRLVELLHTERGAQAVVYLIDEEDQTPKLVAAGGAHPAGTRWVERAVTHVAHVIATGEFVLPCRDPDAGDEAAEPLASLMVLPLRVRGRTLGALTIEASAMPERPQALDPALAKEIAVRAAFVLDSALMYERERDASHTLQMGLLGGATLTADGVDLATAYWPGTASLEVGGDWYDAFALPSGRLALVVGDVVGHSLEAAVAMGQLRGAARALAPMGTPAQLLERLDSFVETLPAAQMATLAYVELEPATGLIRYACAGHPPPLCISTEGDTRFLWDGRSAPLGVSREGSRIEATDLLDERETLVLYTDGLIERRGESIDVGIRRLADMAKGRPIQATELVARICDALLDEHQDDDVCVLALQRLPVDDAFIHSISAAPSKLAGLRRELRSWLEHRDIESEAIQCIILAVSEAAANAVEHAYDSDGVGVVTVTASLDFHARLHATVRDQGTWREPLVDSQRGRGITIINSLMDEVTISTDSDATVVLMTRSTAQPVAT